jgi:hypothetical protein
MRPLPEQPDLDQLRRQARELQRAAARGDRDVLQRLQTVSPRLTLAAAQLALAREYGFPSWARLKAEVERRRQLRAAERRTPRYVLRPVTSLLELTEAFDLIAARMTRPRSWAGGELLAERTDECAPHDGMHAEEGEVRAGHDRAVRQREDKRVGRFDPDRDAQQRGGAEAGDP